ncbi:MAG: hypothetical protein ABWY82_05085, partial [Tardiphaga sp.]
EVTVEQQRERKRKSVQGVRAKMKKSPLRSGDNRDKSATVIMVPDEPEYADADNPEERWQYSLANICSEIIAREAYWNITFPGWRDFECPSHIKTLTKEAVTALASIVKTIGQK